MKHNERIALFVGVRSDMHDEFGGPVISEVRFMQVNDGYTFAIVETTAGVEEVHSCVTFDNVDDCEFRFIEEMMMAQNADELQQITCAGDEPNVAGFLVHVLEDIAAKTGVKAPKGLMDAITTKSVTPETSDVDMSGAGYGMYL